MGNRFLHCHDHQLRHVLCIPCFWSWPTQSHTLCSNKKSIYELGYLAATWGDAIWSTAKISLPWQWWDLWQRHTSFSGQLWHRVSSHSIPKSLAKSIRREIHRNATARDAQSCDSAWSGTSCAYQAQIGPPWHSIYLYRRQAVTFPNASFTSQATKKTLHPNNRRQKSRFVTVIFGKCGKISQLP